LIRGYLHCSQGVQEDHGDLKDPIDEGEKKAIKFSSNLLNILQMSVFQEKERKAFIQWGQELVGHWILSGQRSSFEERSSARGEDEKLVAEF